MTYQFRMMRPGGNDTCLIETGMNLSDQDRKIFNDEIMAAYPNIEQVGFVSLTQPVPRLTMAGGEFCGNATRSAAYLALNGEPGELLMTVSGVNMPLKAGVTEKGEAFAQMPIMMEPEQIKKDGDNYIVPLQGIVQYIDFDTKKIAGKSQEEIKLIAKQEMEAKGLLNNPAVGVMFAEQTADGWSIKPVVWVRSIDTLFYETACGSGTIALTQALAFKDQQSTELSVLQPSGATINGLVIFDGMLFRYAQISGTIERLGQGIIEQKGEIFSVEAVTTDATLQSAFKTGLIKLYQQTFAAPPYLEQFSDADVRSTFTEYLKEGMVYLAKSKDTVVGFGAMLPIQNALPEDMLSQFAQRGFDLPNTWYAADLGVDRLFRNKGIGTALIKARLEKVKNGTVVMRTNENNPLSRTIYESLGFTVVPNLTQTIIGKRQDGSTKSDTRIFLSNRKESV
ncbi:MAG: GNAT family N-acetyltransferase [Microgenomates group bacterium]